MQLRDHCKAHNKQVPYTGTATKLHRTWPSVNAPPQKVHIRISTSEQRCANHLKMSTTGQGKKESKDERKIDRVANAGSSRIISSGGGGPGSSGSSKCRRSTLIRSGGSRRMRSGGRGRHCSSSSSINFWHQHQHRHQHHHQHHRRQQQQQAPKCHSPLYRPSIMVIVILTLLVSRMMMLAKSTTIMIQVTESDMHHLTCHDHI